jgi:ferredoxin-type protein NapF
MAWLKYVVRHTGIKSFSTLLAILLALPLGWHWASGFFIWFSPFVMLNSVLVLKSVVWLNGIALVILVFSFLKKRWFCRYICPAGWACDKVSSCSQRKNFSVRNIPMIGKWLAVASLVSALAGFPSLALLDPLVIFNSFFSVFSRDINIAVILSMMGLPVLLAVNFLFPGIWCARICPLGGLLDIVPLLKKPIGKPQAKMTSARQLSDNRRRLFLSSGTGLAIGLILPRFLKASEKARIRPPGSVEAGLFNVLCLRCGSCIKTCPSDILLQCSDMHDPMTWMTPEISFSNGYCLENCNLCSEACPSGAITLFSTKAKGQLPIALAEVIPDECLLLKHKECDRCKTACKYDAIEMESKTAFMTLPVIEKDKCVGCGACAVICPPETIRMVPIK